MAQVNFKRQWADGPLPLIETPLKKILAEGKTESAAATSAILMANMHNLLIRGMNCIILQAPHVTTAADKSDMVIFAFALCYIIHDHHEVEETLFFPLIEQVSGEIGIMDKNVVQHEVFQPGFHAFQTYVMQIKNGVAEYDGEKIVRLVNDFAPFLTTHLTDEIRTLLNMEQYSMEWDRITKRSTEHAVATAEKYHAVPFFLSNMDVTSENDIHRSTWPPIPWFAQLIFRWIFVPHYKGAWRFSSCSDRGIPKELPFAPLKNINMTNGQGTATS